MKIKFSDNNRSFINTKAELTVLRIMLIGGIGFLVGQLTLASPTVPNPGHSWDEMVCDVNLCIDTATGRVGIGDTTPDRDLDVVGYIEVSEDIIFHGELMSDGHTCALGQILQRVGRYNWDCVDPPTGAGTLNCYRTLGAMRTVEHRAIWTVTCSPGFIATGGGIADVQGVFATLSSYPAHNVREWQCEAFHPASGSGVAICYARCCQIIP